jgi:DnaJ-class molecular chaperone
VTIASPTSKTRWILCLECDSLVWLYSPCTQGKKVAEHRFKAIGEAYAILSDPTKKRRYDNGVPKDKCDDDSSDYGGHGGGGFGGGFGGGGRRSGGFQRR